MISRTLLFAVCAAAAQAVDWRDTLTPPVPGNFGPLRPLKAHYTFGWSAVTAGEADAEFSRTKAGLLALKVRGGSTGLARSLWRLDADSTSLVRPNDLQPLSVVQRETYSDQARKTTVTFGPKGVTRTCERQPKDADSGKAKRFKFAPVFDLQSALLFVRSQPLRVGDVVKLVSYPTSAAYYTEVEVVGHDTVTEAGKKYAALKCALRLQGVKKDLTLQPHKKFKRAFAWLSDDSDRLLLMIESERSVGKVWMDLARVEFGN
jgi:hypothetical protein